MIKAGIIGGAGYAAGELIRILINHPQADIGFVHSKSHYGEPVGHVHRDLVHVPLSFTDMDYDKVDVVFLCIGHGKSKAFVKQNPPPKHLKLIDLSKDFRLKNGDHDFVYGLPELNRREIGKAQRIANPGCFATAIQLPLLPLAHAGMLDAEVHIHGITGSTGAGQALSATSHFSWRNNNISLYKVFKHQHLEEVRQSVLQLQSGFTHFINFVPVRGNYTRGILASVYTQTGLSGEELKDLYRSYYETHPFVTVTDMDPDIKQVVNTNHCFLHVDRHHDKAFITSVSDNLLKGASGQAVQNMNLMFGLEEKSGLQLKPVYF